MAVVDAVQAEIDRIGEKAQGTTMAETALSLARELDGQNSATSKSMCAKALIDVMRELRSLAPPVPEEDEVERARKRRADRLAGTAAAGSSSSS
jgi:hypothetical protein